MEPACDPSAFTAAARIFKSSPSVTSFEIFAIVSVRRPRSNAILRARASRMACSRRRCSARIAWRRSASRWRRSASARLNSANFFGSFFPLASATFPFSRSFFASFWRCSASASLSSANFFGSFFALASASFVFSRSFLASFLWVSAFLATVFVFD